MAQFWVAALCLLAMLTHVVVAQDDVGSNGVSLQDLQNSLRNRTTGQESQTPSQYQAMTLRPNLPYAYSLPPSDLEKYYSERAGKDLRQFGYESFGRPALVTVRQMGALQDTYILGVGDQINVDIRGQDNRSFSVAVNREGNVILPSLPPIPAAGRRLGDVRADIEAKVKSAYIATQAFVSVGALRQISVLVSGEVLAPGAVVLNALNSPIDALLLAGGIKKTGSLRNIKIIRGDKELSVDLYAVLSAADGVLQQSLTDGDKIVVPTIGDTAAVVGDVTRPGIFEIGPGNKLTSASRLLSLAGGYSRGGAPRLSVLKFRRNGQEVMTPITSSSRTALGKGDILFVKPSSDVARGRVVLEGQVRVPGTFDLTSTASLSALLKSPDTFEEKPYMAFAVVSRRDSHTLSRELIPFAPLKVIDGQFDLALQDDDVVHIFGVDEVRFLASRLAAEDNMRNPAAVDLRARSQGGTSTSGEPGEAVQGTVGAALAGQSTSGLSNQTQMPGYPTNQPQVPGNAGMPMSGATASGSQMYQQQLYQQQPTSRQAPPLQIGQVPNWGTPNNPNYNSNYNSNYNPNLAPNTRGSFSQYQTPPERYQQPYSDLSNNQLPNAQGYYYPAPNGPPWMPTTDQAQLYGPNQLPLTSRNLMLDLNDPSVRSQIGDYRVSLLGAVQVPGDYLAAPGVGLDGLVADAGGLTVKADLTGIEVTSTAFSSETGRADTTRTSFNVTKAQLSKIALKPRDVVRFRDLYSDRDGGQVVVRGQVRFPGTFDILRGERMSSLLARAGGLTDVAYPLGAVFARESAARAEEDGYRRAAEELEREFTVLVSDENVSPQGVQFIRETIERLQTATGVGRISVDADPVSLLANPQRDMILEPSDFLFIPRRPNSVSVTGEVLSAGSFLFKSGENGRHYIELAGGFGPSSDKGRTFVLMPDGTARPLTASLLRFRQPAIVPGATIIVPRDLQPFRFGKFTTSVTQILSQLAVSAASIAVVSRNN